MRRSESLSSSAISSIEWDDGTGRLTVYFHHGPSYSYEGVTEEEFEEFAQADSPGRHWHAVFKGR